MRPAPIATNVNRQFPHGVYLSATRRLGYLTSHSTNTARARRTVVRPFRRRLWRPRPPGLRPSPEIFCDWQFKFATIR